MKKINKHFLADVSLTMTPLTEDNEGLLRGGFSGMGGSPLRIQVDVGCTNTCTNDQCVNNKCTENSQTNDCVNNGCHNNNCTNKECSFGGTTGTTETTEPNNPGGIFNGLLI